MESVSSITYPADAKAMAGKQVSSILKELGVSEEIPIAISIPQDLVHGDYTTNVAFQVSKILKKSPMEIAGEIVEKFTVHGSQFIKFKKVEAVKPGFINFYLSETYLISQMQDMRNTPEKIGRTTKIENKKIMVEFADPNPFKEFHIGHLYDTIVGEAISRLLEAQGAEVKRVCYQGDVGMHVAKAIYGIKNLESRINEIKHASLEEKAKFLGEAYAIGARLYEDDKNARQEIIAINKKVYTKEDPEINELYEEGRKWSLEYFNKIYKRLGTAFWRHYFESDAGPKGLQLVKDHIKDGVFEEHDGAVIFRGEQYGLHTRVFINSQGLPTYEAKELGLAPTKYKDFPYDESIIVTANEINEYFKVLLQALSIINPALAKKTKHVSHGFVKLPSGKMSSRSGNILTGEWLLDEAKKKAEEKIQEAKHGRVNNSQTDTNGSTVNSEPTNRELEVISDKVGIGAVKYALLKNSIGRDIEFDLETSVSFEGNAGPYLQYSYVRTQSILEKYNLSSQKEMSNTTNFKYPISNQELLLLRLANQFNHRVKEASDTLSPNMICSYLYELAKEFNLFYQTYRILDAEIPEQVIFRVALTQTIGLILKRGLEILGIVAPERM